MPQPFKPPAPRPARVDGGRIARPSPARPFGAGPARLRYAGGTRTPVAPDPRLGCAVVRRVRDAEHRLWSVREMGRADTRASTIHVDHHTTLLFRCDAAGVRSEIRRVERPLESLTDDDLRGVLHPGE
jgi:hypothetical protein